MPFVNFFVADACSILQAYALGTRLYPPMICEIDKVD